MCSSSIFYFGTAITCSRGKLADIVQVIHSDVVYEISLCEMAVALGAWSLEEVCILIQFLCAKHVSLIERQKQFDRGV